ncbi:MAG: hypothetical protein E7248_07095 [Paenibacillaceae bacterium]|nr:hypothetical protein [Paenibacillaceae bacterium]MBE5983051.1 hypothetical protein [Paenibacillaceae bacterium]
MISKNGKETIVIMDYSERSAISCSLL